MQLLNLGNNLTGMLVGKNIPINLHAFTINSGTFFLEQNKLAILWLKQKSEDYCDDWQLFGIKTCNNKQTNVHKQNNNDTTNCFDDSTLRMEKVYENTGSFN